MQTYLCNDCLHRFSPEAKRHTYPEHVKQRAVKMYCEGMGISSIGRVLGVKLETVYCWLKKKLNGPLRWSRIVKRSWNLTL
jgi:transposase-like protein